MPYRFTSLDDFQGRWHGRIVRVSRIVSKPGAEAKLLERVKRAALESPGVERAYVGFHHADDGRAVILLKSIWESPEALRASHNPATPLGFATYEDLVETWTMEYFEEYLDADRTPFRENREVARTPRQGEPSPAASDSG